VCVVGLRVVKQQHAMSAANPSVPPEGELIGEIVEDRSKIAQGLVKRYRRGKMLGKVRLSLVLTLFVCPSFLFAVASFRWVVAVADPHKWSAWIACCSVVCLFCIVGVFYVVFPPSSVTRCIASK
jgi:hypothetical protein